ncbi:IclR family transcriptional regulator [Allofranklinella schreckenbergeri]|uniref:IclR family transcriptional regulator n=1 Tax=Allofranklinella schreckenbergeri TaxID=1076744 RepID=A0A3M6PVH8_9BURK|nr:IclR family transcriptional regulator C-terminal domain-containing protein [Allofranklinella schreckenbergeri]RMW95102.1 IclR family transcriptional regulator [Allofranklinella schreckenbergeri]RRD41429.1 IclR family transcriptional regulator [Comamonadaceae bacterium OH3737_COT-264]
MSQEPVVKTQDFIDALARGLAILESFDTQRQRLNATQAAERAGLTRAAARRHLLTLAALGYLETDGSGAFWLAPKVLRFSGSYLASARLPRLVQPVLNRLSLRSQAAHSVVVRDQHEGVIVARSGPLERVGPMLPHGLHLGARLPLHATSTGQVLLAALPQGELHAWLAQQALLPAGLARLTANTHTQADALHAAIAQARSQGYALASEQHECGVCALAVPLLDMQGRTHAALNVVVRTAGDSAAQLQRVYLPLLQEAAHELRAVL